MKPLIVSTGDVLVLDPRDVVRHAIARPRRSRRSESAPRARGASAAARTAAPTCRWPTMRRDLVAVAAVDAIDLFDEPRRPACTSREFRPYRSSKPSRSAIVTPSYRLLALGGEDVARRRRASCSSPAGRRRDRRTAPRSRVEQRVERLAGAAREAARRCARRSRAASRSAVGRALQHELARRHAVVRAGVDPEQLRVAPNLGERPRRSMPARDASGSPRGSRASRAQWR